MVKKCYQIIFVLFRDRGMLFETIDIVFIFITDDKRVHHGYQW